MTTLDILADKIRTAYGQAAAFVCVNFRHGYSLSVLDQDMKVMPLPDTTPWDEAMHLIDLCSFEFMPGLCELPAPTPQRPATNLLELFGPAVRVPEVREAPSGVARAS